MKRMQSKTGTLPGLVLMMAVAALGGCGGGSHGGDGVNNLAASTLGADGLSVPALVGTGDSRAAAGMVLQQASCPAQAGKINITASTLRHVVLTLGSEGQEQLIIRTGAGGLTNLEACLVKPFNVGYVSPPDEVRRLLTAAGATVSSHLIVNGRFSSLREVKIVLLKTLDADIDFEQAKRYRIVAYTQNDVGIWERDVLDSAPVATAGQALPAGTVLAYQAIVTKPGYYTIEP